MKADPGTLSTAALFAALEQVEQAHGVDPANLAPDSPSKRALGLVAELRRRWPTQPESGATVPPSAPVGAFERGRDFAHVTARRADGSFGAQHIVGYATLLKDGTIRLHLSPSTHLAWNDGTHTALLPLAPALHQTLATFAECKP